MVERVFADANVLFSASYRESSPLARLWALADVQIVSSTYAVTEAMRNAEAKANDIAHADRLRVLIESTDVVHFETGLPGTLYIDTTIELPEKDWPVLLAALDARCTHFLTGDAKHFGALFGMTVQGMLICRPGEYLRGKA